MKLLKTYQLTFQEAYAPHPEEPVFAELARQDFAEFAAILSEPRMVCDVELYGNRRTKVVVLAQRPNSYAFGHYIEEMCRLVVRTERIWFPFLLRWYADRRCQAVRECGSDQFEIDPHSIREVRWDGFAIRSAEAWKRPQRSTVWQSMGVPDPALDLLEFRQHQGAIDREAFAMLSSLGCFDDTAQLRAALASYVERTEVYESSRFEAVQHFFVQTPRAQHGHEFYEARSIRQMLTFLLSRCDAALAAQEPIRVGIALEERIPAGQLIAL